MDSARRKHYLEALGIEPWLPRTAEPTPPPVQPAVPVKAPTVIAAAPAPVPPQNSPMPQKFPGSAAPLAAVERKVPTDWEGLKPAVAGCMECKLCKTRTNTVFGVGCRSAPLMVVGEGPGADEDAQGEPFVGRAGKLLDEMLRAIGRSRTEEAPNQAVYIANVVKCRPPGNRDPEADEVEACRP
jgi:DNA polymerase